MLLPHIAWVQGPFFLFHANRKAMLCHVLSMPLATSYASLWVELAGPPWLFCILPEPSEVANPGFSGRRRTANTSTWPVFGLIQGSFCLIFQSFEVDSTSGKFWFSGIVASNTMRGWRSVVGVLDKRASLCPTPKTLHPETAQHPPGENRKSQHKNSSCVCVRAKQSGHHHRKV